MLRVAAKLMSTSAVPLKSQKGTYTPWIFSIWLAEANAFGSSFLSR